MNESPLRIVECRTAEEALASMCHWFYEDRLSAEGCEPIDPTDMPDAYRRLLVHNEHMTRRLEDYHGSDVELKVLTFRQDESIYSRNVLLTTHGGKHVVEFGIVRMDLSCAAPDVRDEILERRTPLGEILISHDVLRQVEPHWYLRFEEDSPMAAHFGAGHSGAVYGRLGSIYYENHPAIELLEVVSDARHS